MRYLLDLAYSALLLIASPWLLWQCVRYGKYRQGWHAKWLGHVPRMPEGGPKPIWFHAVSVGEVVVLERLVQEARRRWPRRPFVISSTSRAGYELARSRFPEDSVTYAPLDFSWAVRTALRRTHPELLVLVELELWPNWVLAAHRRGVRLAILNGRLSESSLRGYRMLRPLVARLLGRFSLIAVQNDVYADRFLQLDAPSDTICVTGSLKFDRAASDRNNVRTQQLADWAGRCDSDRWFLAGSTQAPEEQYAVDLFKALKDDFPNLKLAIVPRHPERFDEVGEMLHRSGLPWIRRSQWRTEATDPAANTGPSDRRPILLIDTVGELADWWGMAHIGFVGGSFGDRGGQNMIEPAALGVATCFGPNTANFREISDALVAAQGARVVGSKDELIEFVRRCLANPAFADSLTQKAQQWVNSQRGALQRTMDALEMVLPIQSHTQPRQRGYSTAVRS